MMATVRSYTDSCAAKSVPEPETENIKKVHELLTSTGTNLVDPNRINSSLVFFDCTRPTEREVFATTS